MSKLACIGGLSHSCLWLQVVVSGRGRGGGQMGRGRPPSVRQNQRAAGNERRTVSIEGLSSSTTDMQLRNLLRSIGPIEVGSLCPHTHNSTWTMLWAQCGPMAPSAGVLTSARCFLCHRCSPCSPSRGKPSPNSPVPSTLQTSRWASTGNHCFK